MRKKDRGLPEVVFLGPPQRRIAHSCVVFRVLERDGDGIPTLCRMMRDDEVIDLRNARDGEYEFMTAYVQEQMTKPRAKGAK